MDPAHERQGVAEVAGEIAAMDWFVMRRPIADDHQVLQAGCTFLLWVAVRGPEPAPPLERLTTTPSSKTR